MTALDTFNAAVSAAASTFTADAQAQIVAAQAKSAQLQAALDAMTANDTADKSQVAALTGQLATANQQLAALQAAFDAYKASHPDTTPPPPPPPPASLHFGASVEGGDQTAFVKTIGNVQLGVHRSYWQASQDAAMAARASADLALGTVPLLSTKLGDTWGNVAAGKQDAWLHSMFAALAAVKGIVYLTLHHEPVDNVGAAGSGMTQGDYLNMYRHAYPMKPANVRLGPIIQSAPFDGTGASSGDITKWYPVGACDFAGIDCYNHWDTNKADSAWRTPQEVMVCADQLKPLGLPVIIDEWGVRTDPRTPGKAAKWMADFAALAVTKGVVALSYFNSSQNVNDGGIHPWTLDGERLAEFATLNQQHH